MAKLTVARRERLPRSKFACPTSRSYPVDTKGRIANARTRTKQFGEKCFNQKARICGAARRRGFMKPSYSGVAGWRSWCK